MRTYQFLREFSKEHEVVLVSFIASEKERVLANNLADSCVEIHLVLKPAYQSYLSVALNLWRDSPLQTLYYRSRQMNQVIRGLLESQHFDAAYVHLFRMAPYLKDHSEIYRILDFTDIISQEVQESLPYQNRLWRLIYQIEGPRIARCERILTTDYDELWFISRHDGDMLGGAVTPNQVQIVPNGIDEALYEVTPEAADAPSLLFLGNLDVKHNIDAVSFMAEEILPLIRREIPDCGLNIVGAGNVQNVKKLEQYPGVVVVGYMADLPEIFGTSTVSVAPLRFSSGVQNKVIEAMAAGLPVVVTSSVNQGLNAMPEQDLLLANDAETFAKQVLRLLHDVVLRRHIGDAGRQFVKTRFTTQIAIKRLRAVSYQSDV